MIRRPSRKASRVRTPPRFSNKKKQMLRSLMTGRPQHLLGPEEL